MRTVVENLRYAAGELKKAGIKLLIEPVNTSDIPGFWLTHAEQAVSVIDEVGSDNLFLQYDIYHQQPHGGRAGRAPSRRLKDRIAHVQVADNPGRNEPGTGEINYPFLFEMLDRDRLLRLDRLRIQAGRQDERRAGLGRARISAGNRTQSNATEKTEA